MMSTQALRLYHSRRATVAVLALAAALLTGCVGMSSSSYKSQAIKPAEVEVIAVTADWLAQHAETVPVINPADDAAEVGAAASSYRYVIGPADVLLISVPTVVSFNTQNPPGLLGQQGEGYTVLDDGTIYLPFSGTVKVAGLTLREAQTKIVDALSKYLRSPQVIVAVQAFRSQRVLVTGQLARPGYQSITDVPLTVVAAISSAGGIAEIRGRQDPRAITATTAQNSIPEYPDLSRVILKRNGVSHKIDVEKVLASGDVSQDITLKDGDVVVVPSTRRTSVVVLGEVIRPALMEVPEQVSLAQVLMTAGGVNQNSANAHRVYVIRGALARPTVYQIDTHAPDGLLLAQQFPLQPQDVVYVSETGVTRWNRALQQILPTIQGLYSTAVIVNNIHDVSN